MYSNLHFPLFFLPTRKMAETNCTRKDQWEKRGMRGREGRQGKGSEDVLKRPHVSIFRECNICKRAKKDGIKKILGLDGC